MSASELYDQAFLRHGVCPIESGVLGRLADHECKHGRLPGDRSLPCGCWPNEGAAVIPLTTNVAREPEEVIAA